VHVTVRLFAVLRDRAGASEIDLELPEGARVADALARIEELELTRGIRAVMAVNREYADDDRPLRAGDEVALIPPVSGGAPADAAAGHARVTDQPLSLDPLLAHVRDPRAGAVVTFSGVTREIDHLDYEAYAEMAERLIGEIVAAAIARHGLCRAAAEHRVGRVPLSESSVVVAVSAPHRDAAFAGGREIIDEIKAQAPIWKREQEAWQEGVQPRVQPSPGRSDG
jgi:molybdopterin converting factor subunit 1